MFNLLFNRQKLTQFFYLDTHVLFSCKKWCWLLGFLDIITSFILFSFTQCYLKLSQRISLFPTRVHESIIHFSPCITGIRILSIKIAVRSNMHAIITWRRVLYGFQSVFGYHTFTFVTTHMIIYGNVFKWRVCTLQTIRIIRIDHTDCKRVHKTTKIDYIKNITTRTYYHYYCMYPPLCTWGFCNIIGKL